MNTNDFNYGQTVSDVQIVHRNLLLTVGQILLASFLFAELPSGLISKKLGADRFVISSPSVTFYYPLTLYPDGSLPLYAPGRSSVLHNVPFRQKLNTTSFDACSVC
jgi:hypothetical protein